MFHYGVRWTDHVDPQGLIQFAMSHNRRQPANAANGVGGFLQILGISHITTPSLTFDGRLGPAPL